MKQLVLLLLLIFTFQVNAATQIGQFGITWTFDKELSLDGAGDTYQYGQFANGDYWVVGTVTIIGIDPLSTEIEGRTKNGSMINPDPENNLTGYDSAITILGGYDSNLNVALDVSGGNPLVIPVNSSLVSAISLDPTDGKTQLQTVSILTVLSSAPAANSFRPPYCGTDKSIKFNRSDLNYNLLGTLTPTAGGPTLTTVEDYFERPWLDHKRGWSGDRIHPDDSMPDYGRALSAQIGTGALMLHCDYNNAQKETLFIRFVQLGIDLFGITEDGGIVNWISAGGHGSGRKWPILFAGLVLNDTDMKAISDKSGDYLYSGDHPVSIPVDYIHFGEDDSTFYVKAADIYTQPYILRRYYTDPDPGTANVVNGSNTVTGSGTNWLSLSDTRNDYFGVDGDNQAYSVTGEAYTVASIDSNTQLTLNENYTGDTANGVDYKIGFFVYYGHADAAKARATEEFTSEHLGRPEWGIEHTTFPKYDCINWESSYRTSTADSWAGLVLSAHIMDVKSDWNHDALFDYMDRYMQVMADLGYIGNWERQWDKFTEDMWDTYRADYGTVWSSSGEVEALPRISCSLQIIINTDRN